MMMLLFPSAYLIRTCKQMIWVIFDSSRGFELPKPRICAEKNRLTALRGLGVLNEKRVQGLALLISYKSGYYRYQIAERGDREN